MGGEDVERRSRTGWREFAVTFRWPAGARCGRGWVVNAWNGCAVKVKPTSLLWNPPPSLLPSLLPLLSRFRRRSSPSTGLASMCFVPQLGNSESTTLGCTAHLLICINHYGPCVSRVAILVILDQGHWPFVGAAPNVVFVFEQ